MKNKISVYELLGLIKDGKAPKMIKYKDNNYIFTGYDYHCILTDIEKGFVEYWLIRNYNQDLQSILNEKVEILEEDKHIIEKIKRYEFKENGITISEQPSIIEIADKLNEVIEFLNNKFNH